jgi:hypothetical protein
MRFIATLIWGTEAKSPDLQGNSGGAPPPEPGFGRRLWHAGGGARVVKARSRNIFNGLLLAQLMGKFQHLVLFNGRSQSREKLLLSMACLHYFAPQMSRGGK